MKYNNKYLLLAALATVSLHSSAQEAADTTAEKVPVAFATKDLKETLGGVSVVNVKELTKKNYFTYSLDNMQGYVGGYKNDQTLWGNDDKLILVDGAPRDINNVKPDEIETITFLKGAQAVVLYGSRAAKGVILIKTKRGENTPLRIDARVNTGWNVAKAFPEYLPSAEYMSLYNEARVNDGLAAKYSDQDLYNYSSGLNPYRYPNVDFYSDKYIKKSYNVTDATAEFTGGGKFATFYTNIGYKHAGDLLNFGEAKNNGNTRFNVRGNVDLRLNDEISAFVNANATFYDAKSAVGDGYWDQASKLRPNRVAPLIPLSYIDSHAHGAQNTISQTNNIYDGCFLAGTQEDRTNVFASYFAAGKSKWTSRQFQFDAGLNFDLHKLLEGLSFHTQFSLDYATSYTTQYKDEYATFIPTWSNYGGKDVIVAFSMEGTDKHNGQQQISGSKDNQVIAFNAHFDYNRTFNDVHNLSAQLVANGFQLRNSGEYHHASNANLGLNLSYNYDHKYFADFSMAGVHSARLAPGHREALSPSLSLGWNLAKESFMEDSSFDDLLLSVSGSSLATDLGIDKFYMYQPSFTQADGAWWGWYDGLSIRSVNAKQGENYDLGFIRRKEFSVNLKASLFEKMITADLSYFVSSIEGKIITPYSLYPLSWKTYYPESTFLPYTNYDNDRRSGFDFALNFNKKFGEVDFHAGLNGMFYSSKATKRDDTEYVDEYQHRQGHALDAMWGYKCLGFFKDADDVKNSPTQTKLFGEVKPGDLKYADMNGDGMIDSKDQVDLGHYSPSTSLGMNFSASYKGFTLFVLATGQFGGHTFKNNSYWWVDSEEKYSAPVRGRWTPETAETATYPRLSTKDNKNNFTNSSFWIYSTDRLDLAKVQLTYEFPARLFENSFVKGLSCYVSGNSLLTISKNRDIMEMNVGSEPAYRFYNLGVKVSF